MASFDAAIAALRTEINAIPDLFTQFRDEQTPYIERYRHQQRTLEQLLAQLRQIQSHYGESQITHELHQLISHYTAELDQWGDQLEAHIRLQLDESYKSTGQEPIKINLGTLEFRQQGDQLFAVKFSRPSQGLDDPVREAWFCHCTSKDLHRRMLPLINACSFRKEFIQITPKALGTDLFKYIKSRQTEARANAKAIFAQTCYALDYLHNHLGVAHLDLKPENIFLDGQNLPILGDFGMAQIGSFPFHPINNKQTYKFFFARHMTTQLRRTIITNQLLIDSAPSDILPTFCLSYRQYKHWLQALSAYNFDLSSVIDGVHLNQIPLTGTDEQDPALRPISYSFQAYCMEMGTQQAVAAGIDPSTLCAEDLLAQFSRREFLDQVLVMFQSDPNLQPFWKPDTLDDALQISLVKNLDPELYSRLCSDLSTLAMEPTAAMYGTQAYMAPELLVSRPSYNPFKADVYSLGVIFFILVFGFPPYAAANSNDAAYSRLCQYARAQPPQGRNRCPAVTQLLSDYGKSNACHHSVTDLLDKMMDFNPQTRISIKRIINEHLQSLQL